MTQPFADLPLPGFWLERLWCRPERFLWLSFIGTLDDQTHGHHMLDAVLQFNRCASTRLEFDCKQQPVVRGMNEHTVESGLLVPDGRSRNTAYDSMLHRFRIELDHGTIEVVANDFVFSAVRRWPAPKEEEGRYVIHSRSRQMPMVD